MKFAWLEKMAQEGQVRPEALEKIYEDCGRTLEKHAFDADNMMELASLGGKILFAGAGLGAVASGMSAIRGHFVDAKTQALTDVNRTKIITDQAIPTPDKEKAKARFNEILKYAPSLGANEQVMRQLVMTKYRTGLTDHDVQNLIGIQVKMTPNALDYAAASAKHASAKVSVQEVCGEKLADAYLNLEKVATFYPGGGAAAAAAPAASAGMGFMKSLLIALSVPLAATAGISMAGAAGDAIGNKLLQNKINKSKEDVLSAPKDSIIGANRLKAEQAFSTLENFAPHIAADPHTARAFVTKIVAYSPDKDGPLGIQTSDIRELADIERSIKPGKGFFDNLSTSLTTSGFGKVVAAGSTQAARW
jgi:hypothetical protein